MSTSDRSAVDTERLAAYMEGELTGPELLDMQRELDRSDEARRQLTQMRAIRAALATSPPGAEGLDLAPGIMEHIRHEKRLQTARRTRLALSGVLAAAACIGLAVVAGKRADDPLASEFRVKSAGGRDGAANTAWTGIRAYRIGATGIPEPLSRELSSDDELLFSYVNAAEPAYDYLMIFGLDASGELRWFHPAYEHPGVDPASVQIRAASAPQLLSEVIEHDLAPGNMTLYAVFTRRPLRVSEIERMVSQGQDLQERLETRAALHTLEVTVRR